MRPQESSWIQRKELPARDKVQPSKLLFSNLITWSSSLEPKSLVLYLLVGLKLYPMENPLVKWPHFFDSWLIFDGKLDDNGSSSKNPDIKTPLEKWTHEYK